MKTEVSLALFKLTFNQMKTEHSTEQTSKDTDIYIKLVTAQMRYVAVMVMSFDDKSELWSQYINAQKEKFGKTFPY